jgi:hypothetical protein
MAKQTTKQTVEQTMEMNDPRYKGLGRVVVLNNSIEMMEVPMLTTVRRMVVETYPENCDNDDMAYESIIHSFYILADEDIIDRLQTRWNVERVVYLARLSNDTLMNMVPELMFERHDRTFKQVLNILYLRATDKKPKLKLEKFREACFRWTTMRRFVPGLQQIACLLLSYSAGYSVPMDVTQMIWQYV